MGVTAWAAAKVDVVVVYKVDRFSRSLLDFAKVMERLNAAGASFVSVTQNFSTADAMGRLTLHMLMSFAEFEREMIAERTATRSLAPGARANGPVARCRSATPSSTSSSSSTIPGRREGGRQMAGCAGRRS